MNIGDTKVDIPTSSPPPYVEQPQSRSTAKRVTRVILALVSLYVLLNIISWSSPFSGRPSTARKHRIHWPRPRLPTMSPAEAESHLLQSISAENIREYSRSYTSFAHVAGTEGDLRSAKLAEQRWANLLGVHSHGILESGTHESQNAIRSIGHLHRPTVHVDTYHSLLNYPLGNSSLSMFDSQGKQVYRANLTEPPVKGDETSQHGMQDVPLFHGFSKAGSAKGQLVYANMGRMQDYQRLKDNGIDLNGKIAIVRYGGSFRGLKVSAGESFGIAGKPVAISPWIAF